MADTADHSPRSVTRPCVVEAIGDEVIIECGAAAATLRGDVAVGAGRLLQEQGAIALGNPPVERTDDA